jgi:uncharacterized protein YyaL (SSP411 family)
MPEMEETKNLITEVNQHFLPGKVLLFRPVHLENPAILQFAPFLKNHGLVDGKAAVYICEDQTCQKPEVSPFKLRKLLEKR